MLRVFTLKFLCDGKALSGELSCPCDRSCYSKALLVKEHSDEIAVCHSAKCGCIKYY